eukprot:7481-Heterococcus_DN1.PRE.1
MHDTEGQHKRCCNVCNVRRSTVQVTDDLMDTVFNTNIKSVAFAFKHPLPAIEKSGGKGSVVVNTSIMGVTATTLDSLHGAGVYSASKAAANMLTQYAVSTC